MPPLPTTFSNMADLVLSKSAAGAKAVPQGRASAIPSDIYDYCYDALMVAYPSVWLHAHAWSNVVTCLVGGML